jgi:hypothetical protein
LYEQDIDNLMVDEVNNSNNKALGVEVMQMPAFVEERVDDSYKVPSRKEHYVSPITIESMYIPDDDEYAAASPVSSPIELPQLS